MFSTVREKYVEQRYTPLWPCCANRCFPGCCSIGWVEAIQAPFVFRCSSSGLLLPLMPPWFPTQILEQKTKTQMLHSFTTACKDLATLEVVGLAEHRLNGLQQGTTAPPMCRAPHCPSFWCLPSCVGHWDAWSGLWRWCAPGGLSFLTIRRTGGQHSWQNFALVPIFLWCSCLRQLLILVSRKPCPCCCPYILFHLCNCSAEVRLTCGHKHLNYSPSQAPGSGC